MTPERFQYIRAYNFLLNARRDQVKRLIEDILNAKGNDTA